MDKLLSEPPAYNPIVTLQAHGSQTPLFLIHPGSGDILVFIAFATHFPNRPIYALRARGYNPNETFFPSIQAAAETYAHHICETQPEGPYAVAGYSLGSTLAFELGKLLEARGHEVRFLASIDHPPHIRRYVEDQNWQDVLLHIAYFFGLIDEATMEDARAHIRSLDMSREDSVAYILSIGGQERVRALTLTTDTLCLITDIGENFRASAATYEPIGSVDHMDVFIADPPGYAALDRRNWTSNKLGAWRKFVRSDVEFYECPGVHAKMLDPELVPEFVKSFKAAMKRRGV